MSCRINTSRLLMCIYLIFYIAIGTTVYSQETAEKSTIGVVPFSPTGINEDEALIIAKKIRTALGARGMGIVSSAVMDALKGVECDDSHQWSFGECIIGVGTKLGARYMLGGTISKTGTRFVIVPKLYNVKKKKRVWSKTYRLVGSGEKIYKEISKKIAGDVIKILGKKKKKPEQSIPVATEESITEKDSLDKDTSDILDTVISVDAIETFPKEEPSVIQEEPVDYGIVSGFTFSAGGHIALMKAGREQSQGGFMLSLLFPTSDRSQLRIKSGIPLFRNRSIHQYVDNTLPDPYLGIEHDWAWKYVGITGGLAYVYMQKFIKEDFWDYIPIPVEDEEGEYYYYRVKTSESYDRKNAFNTVLGIRIGSAGKGLYGRISLPLAFNLKEDDPKNFFIEYSAFGVYGWKKSTIGVGIMGMYKRREPDPKSITQIGTPDTLTFKEFEKHFYRDENRSNEFYLLFPCFKYARLIGERTVLALSLELGGLIFPRFMLPDFFKHEDGEYANSDYDDDLSDERYWWKPSIGLHLVYSIAPLNGPHVFDGSF